MAVPVIEGADAWSAAGDDDRGHVGVVVVHGFTGNPVSTRPLGEHLHGQGFTVEVLRLPGHGTSPKDMSRTRYADWLAAVEAAYDDLAERCDEVALVGLSMGGTLCLDVGARRDPAAVVTINVTILNRAGLLPKLAPVLQYIAPMVPASAVGLVADDIKGGGTEKAYDRVPAKSGLSFNRALPRIRAQLPDLTAPVLVAWSTDDHSVPPKNSRRLAELLPGEVRTLELANSYHVATLDLDQDLLFSSITEFLAEATDA